MSVEAQINAMTMPQEFARLANAVLIAEYGNDFLPIDDDRPDRGNDGYLKPERRMFAMHCFKRMQNQSLDTEIARKAVGDLGKAVALKSEGLWDIDAWTFVSNYPMPDGIGARLVKQGKTHGIDVSWWGADHLSQLLQRHGSVSRRFPFLQISHVESTLSTLGQQVDALSPDTSPFSGIPTTPNEQDRLLAHRPDGWEYLLFAGCLIQGRNKLEHEWHDHRLGISSKPPLKVSESYEVSDFLSSFISTVRQQINTLNLLMTEESQEAAFGKPGEPGDVSAIEYYANRLTTVYATLMDAAAAARAVDSDDEYARVFSLAASFVNQPVREIRSFISRAENETNRMMDHLAREVAGEEVGQIIVHLTLLLEFPEGLADEFSAEIDRVRGLM